jgi:hypothetical protein
MPAARTRVGPILGRPNTGIECPPLQRELAANRGGRFFEIASGVWFESKVEDSGVSGRYEYLTPRITLGGAGRRQGKR